MHKFIANLINQYTYPCNVYYKDPKWFWATIVLLTNFITFPLDLLGMALNWIFFREKD